MNRHCNILVNGRAGALHSTAGPDQLRQMVKEIGLDAEIIGTESSEHMIQSVREMVAGGVEKVVVAGGDGTIACAVQEIACTDTIFGILPQGSANNFANALQLPQDVSAALQIIQAGRVREVDLGEVCGRYFTEAAGIGLFADMLALYGQGTNKNPIIDFRPIG